MAKKYRQAYREKVREYYEKTLSEADRQRIEQARKTRDSAEFRDTLFDILKMNSFSKINRFAKMTPEEKELFFKNFYEIHRRLKHEFEEFKRMLFSRKDDSRQEKKKSDGDSCRREESEAESSRRRWTYFYSRTSRGSSKKETAQEKSSPGSTGRENNGGIKRQLSEKFDRCYEVLGLSPSSDFRTVKKRYRELVKQYHPDKPFGDIHKIKIIISAFKAIEMEYRRLGYQDR